MSEYWSVLLSDIYRFWDRAEPNNAFGDEDCVHLLSTKLWNDIGCSNYWQWICEKVI